ncbi:hypothetical protein PV684_52550 [Streptomyces sp. AK02-04a]|nr:hypothetical protein [Streptomyces sp. AK02-04a]
MRDVADEAVGSSPVVIDLSVRRLYCENSGCPRVTFLRPEDAVLRGRAPAGQFVDDRDVDALAFDLVPLGEEHLFHCAAQPTDGRLAVVPDRHSALGDSCDHRQVGAGPGQGRQCPARQRHPARAVGAGARHTRALGGPGPVAPHTRRPPHRPCRSRPSDRPRPGSGVTRRPPA